MSSARAIVFQSDALNASGLQALRSFLDMVENCRCGQKQLERCLNDAKDVRVRLAASLLLYPHQPNRLRKIINLVPKAELHVHLDGSVLPSTIFEEAKRQGVDLREELKKNPLLKEVDMPKNYTMEDIQRIATLQGKAGKDFLSFLLQGFCLPLAVMQTEASLERTAYELVRQAYEDGVIHLEARFAPCLHLEKGLSYGQVGDAVIRGLLRGKKEFGVTVAVILCIYRDKLDQKLFGAKYLDHPSKTAQAAVLFSRKYLGEIRVGLDLAGLEVGWPPNHAQFVNAYSFTFGSPVFRTVHAGEMAGTEENISFAVRRLKADRIGHGIQACNLSADKIADLRHVPLEICPTSNLQVGCIEGESLAAHPLEKLIGRGFRVTLNTDNRTISQVSLTDEIVNVQEKMGLNLFCKVEYSPRFKEILENGISGAFVPEGERATLISDFYSYLVLVNRLLKLINKLS